ncbi:MULTISPECIES: nucleic acid/nucleotide deaminase domain-containing protein [unclassified Streptomyces]|uniref:nucleic acid/nucleotide deaminase domain-containing protein n=1 Tax=unclassified Streptomyces TaxID=2593676 RepID=UPI0037FAC4A5
MTDHQAPAARVVARFGDGGVRRFVTAPDVVVPLQVGPYWTTSPGEPEALADFAEALELGLPERTLEYLRLGSDRGYEICLSPSGDVRGVLAGYDEPERHVNGSLDAFVQGLVALDETLAAIAGTDRPGTAAQSFAALEARLREQDATAFADREDWWPQVLDDIRDTASAEWFAAFEVVDAGGEARILTSSGGICVHPEERLWANLAASGVEPEQVRRVHTELEPCFMPGHYCSMTLERLFPDAASTHNFPYGDTAESRAAGIRKLREAAAQED